MRIRWLLFGPMVVVAGVTIDDLGPRIAVAFLFGWFVSMLYPALDRWCGFKPTESRKEGEGGEAARELAEAATKLADVVVLAMERESHRDGVCSVAWEIQSSGAVAAYRRARKEGGA